VRGYQRNTVMCTYDDKVNGKQQTLSTHSHLPAKAIDFAFAGQLRPHYYRLV